MTEIEIPRLQKLYKDKGIADLINAFAYQNPLEVPKINKIILNMGLGEDASDGKKIKSCMEDMALIAGQKPIITKFKKSISNFVNVFEKHSSFIFCFDLFFKFKFWSKSNVFLTLLYK